MFRTLARHIVYKCDGCNVVNLNIKRYAGHSKWQNIKHVKGEKDAERSLMFSRLGRLMKVAVTEGGGSIDPKLNLKLSQIIDQAKRVNMPTATIQSILKSTQSDKSQAKSHMLEIKGPGSCFILCEVFTPTLHTLKQTISTMLRKHQCKWGDGGGLHYFEEKGIIEVTVDSDKPETELLETSTEHAIEVGAEDVKFIEKNLLQFSCGKSNFSSVVAELEKLGYKITSATIEYTPIKYQNVQDSDLETCQSLYQKLEALPEVVRLFDNIA